MQDMAADGGNPKFPYNLLLRLRLIDRNSWISFVVEIQKWRSKQQIAAAIAELRQSNASG